MRLPSFGFLLLAGFAAVSVPAQDAKFTALFIMNFAKYVEWASPAAAGNFVITVVGKDPVVDELRVIAGKTKIGEQNLAVNQCASVDQIAATNIVYLPPEQSGQLNAVLAKFGSGVLVVTNKEGLARLGAAINLAMIDGKQRYEINPESLKKSGLSAKPALFKLGKVIGL